MNLLMKKIFKKRLMFGKIIYMSRYENNIINESTKFYEKLKLF